MPAYIRPLFCEGKGPFRWAALSGDPEDIRATDAGGDGAVPATTTHLHRWLDMARRARRLPGPAGAHLLARATASAHRARPGASTSWSRSGELKAPIVIGRDHLDTGSVASPEPRDRGDAATAATRSPTGRSSTRCSTPPAARPGSVGAPRRRRRHRLLAARGHGHRRRRHADAADEQLERVLTCDPGIGVAAPRRRRLPRGDRHGAGARREDPDAGADDRCAPGHRRPSRHRRCSETPVPDPGAARSVRLRPHERCSSGVRDGLAGGLVPVHRRRARRWRRRSSSSGASPPTSPFSTGRRPAHAPAGPREAYDTALAYFTGARARDGGPATFLLDEALELRLFESFPGPLGRRCRRRSAVAGVERQPVRARDEVRYPGPARAAQAPRTGSSVVHAEPVPAASVAADLLQVPGLRSDQAEDSARVIVALHRTGAAAYVRGARRRAGATGAVPRPGPGRRRSRPCWRPAARLHARCRVQLRDAPAPRPRAMAPSRRCSGSSPRRNR
ncbi:MAG: hypothetical protein MZW92_53650 [Comamonadaceae bacterium]|nr:hypothetical protein [Comamonadaceae bacterium]